MDALSFGAADAGRPATALRRARALSLTLVGAGVVAYAAFFSWLAITRHDAFRTHTADLGQIDLAIWNTAFGRFVQEVKGEVISTRLTDHFEPIFLPLSLLLHAWNDVRALLVAQAVSLALAALPVFAFVALADRRRPRLALVAGTWAALAYLLAPQAQAATVTDFHASPLAAMPLVLLLLLGYRRRTWPTYAMALVCMAVKEEISLAVVVAGLYFAVWRRWRPGWVIAGVAVAWFCVATFVIIPHYARAEYGLSQSPYLARYDGTATDGGDTTGLGERLLRRTLEPARLRYLLGLLVAYAGMPLLAPEVAAIALSLVGANYVSSYDAMYSGEFHYTAPFMGIMAASAGLGALRLLRLLARRRVLMAPTLLALAAAPLAYQVAEGFTPLGREYWLQRPAVSDHQRLLARFASQIPAGASLSTTPALHPHFSHRERIYTFPDLADAEYVLLDVSGTTDLHPSDLRHAFEDLIAAGYGVVDGADGYLLLRRGAAGVEIPDGFYSFARATDEPDHTATVDYGTSLRLLGYDWLDDAKWGYVRLRLYWQVLAPLDDGLQPYVLFTGVDGQTLADTRAYPFVEPLWYPLSLWRPGETVTTTSVAIPLGDRFEAYVAVYRGDDPGDVAARLPVSGADGPASALMDLNWARLTPMQRVYSWRGAALRPHPTREVPGAPRAEFGGRLELLAASLPAGGVVTGRPLSVGLTWRRTGALPSQVAVSLRLLDASGGVVAQADGSLHGGVYPVGDWPIGECVSDSHTVGAPAAGTYTVALVVYDRATLEPFVLADGQTQLELGQAIVVASP